MLQVQVPIDLGTIATTQSSAFALATPMRVRELLELAVPLALGRRSPADRRERVLRSALEGLDRGDFVIDIDGSIYNDPDSYLLCSGHVTMRFFSKRTAVNRAYPE